MMIRSGLGAAAFSWQAVSFDSQGSQIGATPNPSTVSTGQQVQIAITGAAPNATVNVTLNGKPADNAFGAPSTDANGNWSGAWSMGTSAIGIWNLAYSVGGTPVGTANFQVVQGTMPAGTVMLNAPLLSDQAPASVSSSMAAPAASAVNSAPGSTAGAPSASATVAPSTVPSWVWIAAAAGAALFLWGGN